MPKHTGYLDQLYESPPFLLLYKTLSQQLLPEAVDWLDGVLVKLVAEPDKTSLLRSFSLVSRKVGKADLQMSAANQQLADAICAGWKPLHWSADQAARAVLLLALGIVAKRDVSKSGIQSLLSNADIYEQVAVYQSLPLLRFPEQYLNLAVEGVRSSIRAVFNAIALHNPYPAAYFDEAAWNQMVLKALFENSPLALIEGLDRRANPDLARMLSDYAHERWAANRTVDPELWRSVGPFAKGDMVADLNRVLNQREPIQQEAAALACEHSPIAQFLLDQHPDLKQRIRSGQLTWDTLGTCSKVSSPSFELTQK